MEHTIELLTQQLHALQALQSRNAILASQKAELEARLAEREREIQRLKSELDRQSEQDAAGAAAAAAANAEPGEHGSGAGAQSRREPGGREAAVALQPAAGAAAGGGSGGSGSGGGGEPAPSCDVLPKDLTGFDWKQGYGNQIAQLKAFAEQHRLRMVCVSGERVGAAEGACFRLAGPGRKFFFGILPLRRQGQVPPAGWE